MFNIVLSIAFLIFLQYVRGFMKKYGLALFVLCASINYEIFSGKEFSNFEVKNEARYLGSFIKCMEYGPTEVPGLIQLPEAKTPDLLLRAKKNAPLIFRRQNKNNYNICSRNFASLNEFIASLKENESKELCQLGYQLKSYSLNVFPKDNCQDLSISIINKETGSVEKKEKVAVDLGESIGLPEQCIVLVVDVNDKSVSNAELGYVASKILAAEKNTEFVSLRYRIKATVLNKQETESISMSSLLFSEEQE